MNFNSDAVGLDDVFEYLNESHIFCIQLFKDLSIIWKSCAEVIFKKLTTRTINV